MAMQPKSAARALLPAIPAVSRVQSDASYGTLVAYAGAPLAVDLVRAELARLRKQVVAGRIGAAELKIVTEPEAVVFRARAAAEALLAPAPRLVINATGVVVHTNLGRSILSEPASRRVAECASAYMDLELDLETGARGRRIAHLEPLLARLFPGAASAAFNNNAAAILLALRALAAGREVIVARGELVEIGGSFRIPDILAASGARLREVGTTNRTRVADYRNAITKATALLLKVHTSNFKVIGFTEESGIDELAQLGRKRGIPVVVDWGSGDLVDLAPHGIRDESTVREILAAGADLVTFSADKLLGGPQAGIVVGRRELVDRIAKDPLARVCRLDRLAIAALHETLLAYVRGRAWEEIPTLRMIAELPEQIGARAESVRHKVAKRTSAAAWLALADGVSRTGGGSSPIGERPTRLLVLNAPAKVAVRVERALRGGEPAVLGRMHDGKLLLDLRTVLPSQDAMLATRLAEALDAVRVATPRSGS